MAIVKKKSKSKKLTAKDISRTLGHRGPVAYRHGWVTVTNVSWGFLDWEADLLACSKSGYLTEVEIKVTVADWKADKHKRKWTTLDYNGPYPGSWNRIKYFYYAAPEKLARRWPEFDLPDFVGIIAVKDETQKIWGVEYQVTETIRQPKKRKVDPVDLNGRAQLARLGAIRYWTLAAKG